MKKMIQTMILLLALVTYSVPALADRHNYDQWASMEYKQWKFSPKAYYYSWYKKWIDLPWPLSGFWIKVPGAGVHDKGPAGVGIGGDNYVNEPWRQMSGLRTKAVTFAGAELVEAKKVRKQWDSIRVLDLKEMADKAIDLACQIGKGSRKRAVENICRFAGMLSQEESRSIMEEYLMLKEKMGIIGKSFVSNSEKAIAYNSSGKQLERLSTLSAGILILRELEKRIRPRNGSVIPNENTPFLGHGLEEVNGFNDKL